MSIHWLEIDDSSHGPSLGAKIVTSRDSTVQKSKNFASDFVWFSRVIRSQVVGSSRLEGCQRSSLVAREVDEETFLDVNLPTSLNLSQALL